MLLRFQKDKPVFVYDLETESLNLRSRNLPWQIAGAVMLNGKIEERFEHHIWWPQLKVGKDAARITRFDYQSYRSKAKDPEEVWDFYKKYFTKDYIISGHNILGFDVYITRNWLEKIGKFPGWNWIDNCVDTNCLAKAYMMDIGAEKPLIDWQYKLTSFRKRGVRTSLGAMCKHFDIEYDKDKAHDALYDIGVNCKLYNKLIWALNV